MDDIKNIIDNLIEIKSQIEQRIYKYMYLNINNKNELDSSIAEDKEFIEKIQSILDNNKTISNPSDNISMPSIDTTMNENIESIGSTQNEELPALEMIDLGIDGLNDDKQNGEVVDELQELTSSSQSSDVWMPPEITPSSVNSLESQPSSSMNLEEQNPTIPESQIPSIDSYSQSDNLMGVTASNTNKFITPEFMNSSQSL